MVVDDGAAGRVPGVVVKVSDGGASVIREERASSVKTTCMESTCMESPSQPQAPLSWWVSSMTLTPRKRWVDAQLNATATEWSAGPF